MIPPEAAAHAAPARLLDQVRERVRYLHYSLRTEQAYVHWIRAFVRFHGLRHPKTMGGPEVEAFLSWLSAERSVSVSTHRQALSALLFLYQQVFGAALPWMQAIGRPQRKPRLPEVLSVSEVRGTYSAGGRTDHGKRPRRISRRAQAVGSSWAPWCRRSRRSPSCAGSPAGRDPGGGRFRRH